MFSTLKPWQCPGDEIKPTFLSLIRHFLRNWRSNALSHMLGTRVYGFVHNVQVPWFFKNCLQQVKLPAGVWICVLVQKLRCRSIRGWRNYPPWGFCVIKIKCHKEVTKYCSKNPGFSHYFCLIMERYGSGSEPWLTNPEPGGQKTYRSGSGTLSRQCCGYLTFWFGSADPNQWVTDPDPVSGFQDVKKKVFFLLCEGTFTSVFKNKK